MYAHNSKRSYYTILVLIAMGYTWLLVNMLYPVGTSHLGICIFKRLSGLPCPSCGSTRSAILALHGSLTEALLLNPLGFVILIALVGFPLGFGFDLVSRRKKFFVLFMRLEQEISRPKNAIAFAILIIINWAWNIYKHV